MDTLLVTSLFVVSIVGLVFDMPDAFVRTVLSLAALRLVRPFSLTPSLRYAYRLLMHCLSSVSL